MLFSIFHAASAAAILVVLCALARTKTRLPAVGVGAPRVGAQDDPPLVTSTGPRTATPLREPAASVVAMPNEMLCAQSAPQLNYAIAYASTPFDMSLLPRLRAALFSHSF